MESAMPMVRANLPPLASFPIILVAVVLGRFSVIVALPAATADVISIWISGGFYAIVETENAVPEHGGPM
jgi:hypothetical protein